MDDFLEQTVVRRQKGAYTLLYGVALAFMVVFGIIALLALSNVVGMNPESGGLRFSLPALATALIFGGAAYGLFRLKDECRVEYDYTFTNGCLDICKVLNDRRRRYLCALEMKEVLSCGPASGEAFRKLLNTPGIQRHNWFLNREAKLYYFYFQKKGVKHLAVLELNDEMISVIRSKKYLQPGAWHDADGKSINAGIS